MTAARGAVPRTSPLAPSMPLGTSIATTGSRCSPIASMTARVVPSTGRASPAPKMPSTTVRRRRAPPASAPRQRPASVPQPARRHRVAPRQSRAARGALASLARPERAPLQNRRRRYFPGRRAPRPVAAATGANRVGDLAARILHQLDAGDAARCRKSICLAHLCRAQKSALLPACGGDRHRRRCGERAIPRGTPSLTSRP